LNFSTSTWTTVGVSQQPGDATSQAGWWAAAATGSSGTVTYALTQGIDPWGTSRWLNTATNASQQFFKFNVVKGGVYRVITLFFDGRDGNITYVYNRVDLSNPNSNQYCAA